MRWVGLIHPVRTICNWRRLDAADAGVRKGRISVLTRSPREMREANDLAGLSVRSGKRSLRRLTL